MDLQAGSLFNWAGDADRNERLRTLRFVRDHTPAETEKSKFAERLLRNMTEGSALSELRAATSSLHEAIEMLERKGARDPTRTERERRSSVSSKYGSLHSAPLTTAPAHGWRESSAKGARSTTVQVASERGI